MRSLRVLVVDDEALARDALRLRLEREPDVELLRDCAGGCEAVERIRSEAPDLVFLDVQMPDLDGFEVLAGLDEDAAMPLVIFATAYDEFALAAFDRHAVDYLLKPFDDGRFQEALDRARDTLKGQRAQRWMDRMKAVLTEIGSLERVRIGAPTRRILVHARGRRVLLPVDRITHARADGNYVRLYVGGGKYHLIRGPLDQLERRLGADRFARIHRSAVVNLDRVTELVPEPRGSYAVVLEDGTRLSLGRSFRDRVLERWAW